MGVMPRLTFSGVGSDGVVCCCVSSACLLCVNKLAKTEAQNAHSLSVVSVMCIWRKQSMPMHENAI